MNVLDKTLLRQVRAPQASELNVAWRYRDTYCALLDISQKLAVDDMGCDAGYALVVQWSRTCGYELHEPFKVNAYSFLLSGHRRIHRWEDIVNCALNFMVNNHVAMGEDLGTFLNELCKVARYLSDNFNDRCRIDQVEPGIFRVMTDEEKPIQLFTWEQKDNGYNITRSKNENSCKERTGCGTQRQIRGTSQTT